MPKVILLIHVAFIPRNRFFLINFKEPYKKNIHSMLIEYTWSDADFELIQDFEWTLTMRYACKIKRAK